MMKRGCFLISICFSWIFQVHESDYWIDTQSLMAISAHHTTVYHPVIAFSYQTNNGNYRPKFITAGYPRKLYFQISCVFPVQPQIFPVPIFIICDYNIHKTMLADLFSLASEKKN